MSNVSFKKSVTALVILPCLLALLLSLTGHTSPASASLESLRWTKVNIPAGGEPGNWVLADGSNVRHLALAGDGTIYASVEGLTDTLYRSGDGGLSWSNIGNARETIIDIAIAPNDAKKVYYATASAVYRSANGGKTFAVLPANPGGAGTGHREITSLDVASLTNNIIAVAVRDTDSAKYGGVYILDESNILPLWVNSNIGNYDVYAVAFSPNYASDRQLIAVTTNETDTFIASKSGDAAWNAATERVKLNRDNTKPLTHVALAGSASVAFSGNYDADPASESSVFFVAIATGTGEGDVYRIDNAATPVLAAATDLNTGQKYGFNNIDFSGLTAIGNYPAAILIAGEADSSRTYTSTDGGLNWTRSRKEPSGAAVTCLIKDYNIATTGRIYAATSGTNSAFSVSRDLGVTWNQLSLIDTTIDTIVDLALSPRYTQDNTLFMLTFGGGHSLWRSHNGGNNWERILTYHLGGVDTLKLVGLPPRYGDDCQTVFAAGVSNGSPAVWQSTDDGQSYRYRFTHDPVTGDAFSIDVWAMVDENSFFVGSYDSSNSIVYLTTSSGFVYSEGIPAGDQPLNSLAISPFYRQDGIILAGNTDGWVYLSTDNFTSFRPLPRDATSPPLSGSVAIAFDPNFNKNQTVYAASDSPDGAIYSFAIPSDQEWSSIDATLPAGAMINRLAVATEGTLYATNSQTNGGLERCLYPTSSTNMVFERVTRYLPAGATLSGLWQCGHHLWSVDTSNASLLTFYDTLTAPVNQVTPAKQASGIGSLSSHTVKNIVLNWKTLEGATSYQWQCDYSAESSSVSGLLEDTTTASSVRLPALEPSTTYYWRVRASAPVLSPWSEKWSFTTSLDTEAITLKPESPVAGAIGVPVKPAFQWSSVNGASAYELLVANNAEFDHPVIVRTDKYALPTNAWQCDVSLDFNAIYYWKVRAVSESTSSPWSSTGIFTTEPAPAKTPESVTVFPMLSQANQLDSVIASNPAMLSAPMPVIPTQAQIKPSPTSSPPQNIAELPAYSQSLNMPAWIVYLMFGLLATIVLALFVILAIVLKIKRF